MSSSLSKFEGSLSPSTLISILVSIYIRQYTGRFIVNNTRKTRVIGILSGTPIWINRDDVERTSVSVRDQKGNILIKNDRLDVFLTQTVDVMLRLGLISQRPIEKLVAELKSRSRNMESNQDSEKIELYENTVVIREEKLTDNKIIKKTDIQIFHVQQNIEALAEVLSWKSGTWKFEVNDELQLDNIDPILLKIHPKKYSLALQIPYVICYASTEFVLKQQLSLQATQWQNAGEDLSKKTSENGKKQVNENTEHSVFRLSKSTVNSNTQQTKSNSEEKSILFEQLDSQSKQEGKTVSPYEKFLPPVFLEKMKDLMSGEMRTNDLFAKLIKIIKKSNTSTSAVFFPNDIYKNDIYKPQNIQTNGTSSNRIDQELSDKDVAFGKDLFVVDGTLQGLDKEGLSLFFQLRNSFERFSDEHILLSWIWIATQLQIIELKEGTEVVQESKTVYRRNTIQTSKISEREKEYSRDISDFENQPSSIESTDEKRTKEQIKERIDNQVDNQINNQIERELSKEEISMTTDQSGLLLSETTAEDANRVEALQRLISGDYRKKVGQNFYAFLGLDKSSSKDKIQKEITKLRSRWTNLTSFQNVRVDVMKQAKSLLSFLIEVEDVMLNDKKKREYDRELLFGRAAVIGGGSVNTTVQMSGDPIDGIRHLVDNEEYQKAIPHLEEKRREKATSEVLALLGWCLWNTSRKREAEDIISLSLTIGKPTTRALKYATQIALEQGKKRRAKRRLLQLLQIDPENDWAKDSLSNL